MGSVVTPFKYELPKERIAQRPIEPTDAARLLVVNKEDNILFEKCFSELDKLLDASTALILNNTRVIPARLFGTFLEDGSKVELLLLKKISSNVWYALGRPMKDFKVGVQFEFPLGLKATILNRLERTAEVQFKCDNGNISELLKEVGTMPIPPYIRDGVGDEQDKTDYQTLFSKVEGSVAAPTASLHFTLSLIERLKKKGVPIFELTLHVGTASFLPVVSSTGQIMPPGFEEYLCDESTWEAITQHRNSGGKIVAVGTTAARALESIAGRKILRGTTDLFIQPGYQFQVVDGLITNFHQPGTTHLLLVEALIGRELLEQSYKTALKNEFRFLSYGDAMYING